MKRSLYLVLSWVIIFAFGEAQDTRGLSERWKKWLGEEVVYIMSSRERDVFLELRTEREREAFEQAFWRQRDPTPGSEANELNEEHYRRLSYANGHFGRGTFKRGWETDQGRIYIILGKPGEIETFEGGSQNLVPSELWFYRDGGLLGLPSFFYILFYRDQASSEFKLYSPSFDGPQRLLRQTPADMTDRYSAYQQLMRISPELAQASISLIPGSGEDPASSTSSLSSDILLSNIPSASQKKVRDEWAVAFAKNKEIITTDYSVDYIQSDSAFYVHQDGDQIYLHFMIEPHRLEMSRNELKAQAPLKLNIKISDPSGAVIHQEEKDIQIEVSPENIKKVERRMLAIGDLLPLVDGRFTVDFLLRNTISKAFSSVEEAVSTPRPGVTSLSPLLLLHDAITAPPRDAAIPFLIHGSQLYPNARKIYTTSDDVVVFFEIYNPATELHSAEMTIQIRDGNTVLFSQAETVGTEKCFLRRYPLHDFHPGDYQLVVTMTETGGREVAAAKEAFQVNSLAALPRPLSYNKIYPPVSHPYFSVIRAYQYLGLKKYDRVIQEIEKFYDRAHPNQDIAMLLARAHFNKDDYGQAVEILDPLKDSPRTDVLVLLGKSYFQLGNFPMAILYFKKDLDREGEVLEILNLLGFSYLKNGESEEALKYFNRSLRLNPDQPNIRQLVER